MSKALKILVENVKTLSYTFFTLGICSLVDSWKNFYPFYCENENKSDRYWIKQRSSDVIQKADRLFEEYQFLDVYELLNRLKYFDNAEVHWRIARALFKMSSDEEAAHTKQVRKEMIIEAYNLIQFSLKIGKNNANVHKWYAIIADAKYGWEGTDARVRGFKVVKNHMLKAVELNPNDVVVLYMLGKLCYEMSHLTCFQRFLARVLYATAPSSSYEEAYYYFSRAERISPRFYLPNLYMLGKTCFRMKQYYRARYYLSIAANLPPRTTYEQECANEAKILAKNLENYDLHLKALVAPLQTTI